MPFVIVVDVLPPIVLSPFLERKAELDKSKKDFKQLLRDTPEIGPDSRFDRV